MVSKLGAHVGSYPTRDIKLSLFASFATGVVSVGAMCLCAGLFCPVYQSERLQVEGFCSNILKQKRQFRELHLVVRNPMSTIVRFYLPGFKMLYTVTKKASKAGPTDTMSC